MKDEAEAQEMSLEEELKAATQGGFVENRPPTNLLRGKGIVFPKLNCQQIVD
jgi:hypothetical protein